MRSPDRKLPAGAAWGHDPGRRMRRFVLLLAACSCGAAGAVWAQTYDNPPAILDHYVEIAVGDIVSTGQAARVGQVWSSLVFWTAADAIDGDVPGTGVHDIPPDRYGLETSRTDKQLGASASSNGSTSAVEKSGIPQWLAFAIEHGAIDKTVNGTNLTLTTSYTSNQQFRAIPETDFHFFRLHFDDLAGPKRLVLDEVADAEHTGR